MLNLKNEGFTNLQKELYAEVQLKRASDSIHTSYKFPFQAVVIPMLFKTGLTVFILLNYYEAMDTL